MFELGLLPILQWLVSLEHNPQPTRALLTIERLQGWTMLAYYPLEHIYYLCSHGIMSATQPSLTSLLSSSSTSKPIKLNPDALSMWSCRFWAVYVALQFAHLREDRLLLQQRQRSLRKAKGTGSAAAEKQELNQRWDAYWNEIVVNLGYLPLTIHWCVHVPFHISEWCDLTVTLLSPLLGLWRKACLKMRCSTEPLHHARPLPRN